MHKVSKSTCKTNQKTKTRTRLRSKKVKNKLVSKSFPQIIKYTVVPKVKQPTLYTVKVHIHKTVGTQLVSQKKRVS